MVVVVMLSLRNKRPIKETIKTTTVTTDEKVPLRNPGNLDCDSDDLGRAIMSDRTSWRILGIRSPYDSLFWDSFVDHRPTM